MKLKQPRETPSRLRELEMRDTPPIQQKTKAVRYADDQNQDSANCVVEFRRRTRDSNQLYHSQEFMNKNTQKSLLCNQVYDNNDLLKQSLRNNRSPKQSWALTQSQENLLQEKKPRLDSSINFRSMRPQNNMLTGSRQFLNEKQIVNDVIDDLIKKSQKNTDDHSRDNQVIMCSNEDGKKAKYRMEDPDEELYYCSKCSIMLLQKGFQVTELSQSIRQKPKPKPSHSYQNKQQFNQMSFKIKCLKQSVKNAIKSIDACDLRSRYQNQQIKINDIYELIISVTDSMRKKDLAHLKQNFDSVMSEKVRTKNSLCERYSQLEGMENEVDNLDVSCIEDERARSMLISFDTTIDALQQEPANYDMTIIEETVDSRLERLATEVKQHWPKGAIQFSFEKADRFDNFIKEAKQPFRHLFPEQDEVRSNCFGNISKGSIEHRFLKTKHI